VGHDGDEWLQARGAGVAARGEGGGGAVNLGGGRLETKEQRRPNLELAAATMAAAFRSARSTRERGKESGEASECSGSSGVCIWRHREQGGAWRVARRSDARQQWGARAAAWLPRRQFNEHVACVSVPDLGSVFWHILCGFRTWLQ